MQYLTISEYARLLGVRRQAIQDRVRRKTLPFKAIRVSQKRIPVDDTEYKRMQVEMLARCKVGE